MRNLKGNAKIINSQAASMGGNSIHVSVWWLFTWIRKNHSRIIFNFLWTTQIFLDGSMYGWHFRVGSTLGLGLEWFRFGDIESFLCFALGITIEQTKFTISNLTNVAYVSEWVTSKEEVFGEWISCALALRALVLYQYLLQFDNKKNVFNDF